MRTVSCYVTSGALGLRQGFGQGSDPGLVDE